MMMSVTSVGSSGGVSMEENEEEGISRMVIASFQAREEEIEKRKMEVKVKVESQLNRAEQQTKRLAHIWEVCTIHILSIILYIIIFSSFR